MATLTVYPDAGTGGPTGDAQFLATGAGSFASLRSAAGDSVNNTTASEKIIGRESTNDSGNPWDFICRAGYTLDTSALTSAANISAAVFSLYGATPNEADVTLNIYAFTPATDYNFAATDYAQVGSTAYCNTSIDSSTWSTSGYNDFSFNATGIAAISKTGITKLSAREKTYDADGGTPTWPGSALQFRLSGYYSDQAGTGNDPKLVITYSTNQNYVRSLSDSTTTAAQRVVVLGRLAGYGRAPADNIMNAVNRLAVLTKGVAIALADSIMNAVSRFAYLNRLGGFGRTTADNIMNAASRLTILSRSLGYLRSLTVNIMNGASRLTTLASARTLVRLLTVNIMNGASRLTLLAIRFTVRTLWRLVVVPITNWIAKNRGN
jgi:hypothetical protein